MTLHVVVIGAGYSGLAARWTDANVTLINARDRFVERVRLHQLATGQRLRDLPIADLLKDTRVRFLVDRVTELDPARRTLRLAPSPRAVNYDMLIYALGSDADLDSAPGVAEHTYPVANADQADRLRQRIRESTMVAVVGGGLTGIEAAAELAEARPGLEVRLVTRGPLGAALSRRGQRYPRRTFHHLGVEIRENTCGTEVRPDGLLWGEDELLGADTVVWTSGFLAWRGRRASPSMTRSE